MTGAGSPWDISRVSSCEVSVDRVASLELMYAVLMCSSQDTALLLSSASGVPGVNARTM